MPTFTYINLELGFIQEYLDETAALDPTVQYLMRHPQDPVVHDGVVITESEKDRQFSDLSRSTRMTAAARVFSAFAVPVAMLLAACGPASEPVEQAMTPAVPMATPVSAQPAPAPESHGVAAPTALGITDPSIARELMDVAGIRLGMNEAQAMAALNAFEPAAKIRRNTAFFGCTDDASMFQTEGFIDYVSAQSGTGNRINVYFSGPLGEPRVIKFRRSSTVVNGPRRTEFLNALISRSSMLAEWGSSTWGAFSTSSRRG